MAGMARSIEYAPGREIRVVPFADEPGMRVALVDQGVAAGGSASASLTPAKAGEFVAALLDLGADAPRAAGLTPERVARWLDEKARQYQLTAEADRLSGDAAGAYVSDAVSTELRNCMTELLASGTWRGPEEAGG